MEDNTLTTLAVGIIILGLVVSLGAAILISFQDSVETTTSADSSSQTILSESTATLTPIGEGISSSEVNANNRTWINCTTSDSLVVDINESKATVSVWFNNLTTAWTSLIKSDGDIYINGSVDAAWIFLPYFVSGDIITFCKTDGSTFIDVSVDAIRVYEQALNSTEVTQVFNYGR